MKKLYIYTFTRLLKSFALAITSTTCILSIASFMNISRYAVRWGINDTTVIKVLPVVLAQQMIYALPLSCSAGATLLFSDLSRNNELIAMESTTFDTRRLLFVLIPAGILITILTFAVEEASWGWGMHRIARAFINDAAYSIERRFNSGAPINPDGRGKHWMVKLNRKGSPPYVVYTSLENGDITRVFSGELKEFRWLPESQTMNLKISKGKGFIKDTGKIQFASLSVKIKFLHAIPSLPYGKDAYSRSLGENILFVRSTDLPPSDRQYRRSIAAIHTMLSLLLSPLPLIILGAAFGVMVRFRGHISAFTISVLSTMFIYYPVWMTSREMIESGKFHGIFIPHTLNGICLITGTVLFCRWSGRD